MFYKYRYQVPGSLEIGEPDLGFFRVFFVKLRSNGNVILIKVSGTEMWVDKNMSIKFYSTLDLSNNRTHTEKDKNSIISGVGNNQIIVHCIFLNYLYKLN